MRLYCTALLAGATMLVACGGEKPATDSAAANAAATTPATPSTAAATTPAAAPTGAVAAAAPTGATHEIKMIGDATGYHFDPATITIKSGDAVKYTMTSGGPHNVAFQNVTNPTVAAQLEANMPGNKMGPLSGPMVMQPNETYTVSFAKVPAGTYDYICVPHMAMNMKGVITVQ